MGTYESTKIPKRKLQFFVAISAALAHMLRGHTISQSSFLLASLEDPNGDIYLSSESGSWFASIFTIGQMIGSVLGGFLTTKFGRKKCMMAESLVTLVGIIMIAVAVNVPMLLIGRFLAGIGSGSCGVSVPMFVGEISHPDFRGFTGSLMVPCYTFGTTSALVLGALLPWRYAIGVTGITAVVCLLSVGFICPESPVWLVQQDRTKDAQKSLKYLRGDPALVKEELERIKKNAEKNASIADDLTFVDKLKVLKNPRFLKPLCFLILWLQIGLAFVGFPMLAYYAVPILREIGLPFDPYWGAALIAAFRSILTMVTSGVMTRSRRRPVFLTGAATIALGTCIIGTQSYFATFNLFNLNSFSWFGWIPLVGIFVMYIGFSTYAPVAMLMQGEILPADKRSLGSSILGITDGITQFILLKNIPAMVSGIKIYGSFWMFCCIAVGNLIISSFIMPETKGRTLEDIESYFRGEKVLFNTVTDTAKAIMDIPDHEKK